MQGTPPRRANPPLAAPKLAVQAHHRWPATLPPAAQAHRSQLAALPPADSQLDLERAVEICGS